MDREDGEGKGGGTEVHNKLSPILFEVPPEVWGRSPGVILPVSVIRPLVLLSSSPPEEPPLQRSWLSMTTWNTPWPLLLLLLQSMLAVLLFMSPFSRLRSTKGEGN